MNKKTRAFLLICTVPLTILVALFGLLPQKTAASTAPQAAASACFVSVNDSGITDYESSDASAVQTAVNNANPDDLIKVAGTCAGVQAQGGFSQTVYISQSLTVQGGYTTTNWTLYDPSSYTTTLDAENSGRVIYIPSGGVVTLDSLSIQNGYTTGNDDGAGIYSVGTLTVTNSLIRDNQSAGEGGGLYAHVDGVSSVISNTNLIGNIAIDGGGGFYAQHPITITNSLLGENRTSNYGAGGWVDWVNTPVHFLVQDSEIISNSNSAYEGGGLYIYGANGIIQRTRLISNTAFSSSGGGLHLESDSIVSLLDSEVAYNVSGDYGGGISMADAVHLTVQNSSITHNTAPDIGGGIHTEGGGVLTITTSTIAYNSATNNGGGLHAYGLNDISINNSTISHNEATLGGGIYAVVSNSGSRPGSILITLTHTTLYSNTATQGSGIYLRDATDGNAYTAQVTLQNSIIASNSAGDCATENGWEVLDATLGYNLDSDGSCIAGGGTGNITGDPLLGSLADNGGDTLTHALLPGSPALDMGDPAYLAQAGDYDQRGAGYARVVNGRLDIGAYERNVYAITVTVDGNGSVSSDPAGISCESDCDDMYDYGTVVTLTAVISPNFTFTGWTGSIITTTNPLTLTMDAAKDVTATFTLDTHELAVNLAGNGSVSSDPAGISCESDCSEVYDYGTVVTLTAVISPNFTFTGWTGAIITTTNPLTLTMDAAKNVTATFTLDQYTLTTATDGSGTGNVTLNPAGGTYDYGTAVTVTHSANAGSTFTGWSGDCAGSDSCVVTMDMARSVTATFTLDQYTLTTATDGSGTGNVTLNPAGGTYDYGTAVTVTHSADTGSTFTGWSGACSGMDACVVIISESDVVTATFTLGTNVLTVLTDGTGSGSVNSSPSGIECGVTCAAVFDYGTVVTLTVTADAGSAFTGWSGACSGMTDCVVTMDAAKEVTATFNTTQFYIFLPVILK